MAKPPLRRSSSSGQLRRITSLLSRILGSPRSPWMNSTSPAGSTNLSLRNWIVAPFGPVSSRAMPARRGRLVRPLLGLGRDEVRREVEAVGLNFADDPSNLDPAFARARIRSGVMPVLGQVNPAFERNVARTLEEVGQEAEFLEQEASGLLQEGLDRRPFISAEAIAVAPPAIARYGLRLLAERVSAGTVPVSIETTTLVRRLAGRPEGGSADLGGGLRIEVGSGLVLAEPTASRAAAPDAPPALLPVPGAVGWAGWLRDLPRAGVGSGA